MSERFFVSPPIDGDHAALEGAEAHHLAHVLRAKPGDVVTLLDGSGCEFDARIERIGKERVELAVLERRSVERESPLSLTLAVALPKGDRQGWLVEKLVELGATALAPLITQRGVAQPTSAALERLRRRVIEASKQCGRNRLMEITDPCPWGEFVSRSPTAIRLLAHCGGTPLSRAWPAGGQMPHGVTAAVGPEGGFSEEEISAALAAGWKAVDLGPRVLRVETAAAAIAAWAAFQAAAAADCT